MPRLSRPKPILPVAPHLEHEAALRAAGYAYVAGIDEAGRGAWAGPVVAAAVILPNDPSTLEKLVGVNDSKKLTAKMRLALRDIIEATALAWAVGQASHSEIDQIGIVPATRLAMQRAIETLTPAPHALVIDAVKLPALKLHQRVFNFADAISLSVAAASILAKTERDGLMCALDADYPDYRFGLHKGYGTRAHAAALEAKGISPVHRCSFKPIAAMMALNAHVIS